MIKSAVAEVGIADVGGDGLATQQVPTWWVALAPATGGAEPLAKTIRTGTTSIIGRIQGERLLIDLRSVYPRQDALIAAAFEKLATAVDSLPLPPGEGRGEGNHQVAPPPSQS